MPEIVAVVGSRHHPDLGRVSSLVQALWARQPDTIVVSGGAQGVDSAAEQTWIELGGTVISFRPRERADLSFVIDRYRFGSKPSVTDTFEIEGEPSFADFASAAFFRNLMILEHAHRVVAFLHRNSPGTRHTIGAARDVYGLEPHVYESQ